MTSFMKKTIPAVLICAGLLAACEKPLPEQDIDFGKSQALVMYLSDVTGDADAIAVTATPSDPSPNNTKKGCRSTQQPFL